jgi:hypothetical protein
MNRFEFYQKHYFFELDRRTELNSSLSIPLGVFGLLSGALVYLVSNFNFAWDTFTYIFLILVAGAVVSILLVVYFLLRAYWSYDYMYMTDTEVIRNYENELTNYYKRNGQKNVSDLVDKELDDMLIHKYSEAGTHTAANNAKKSATLRKSNSAIVALVIFLLLLSPVFFVNNQLHAISRSKVNSEEPMGKQKETGNDKHVEKSEKPLEKPKEPPNKLLNEFSEKEKKGKQNLNE